MSLAIDIVDGHGLNNETRRQLRPKKTKITLHVLAVHIIVKGVLAVVHY